MSVAISGSRFVQRSIGAGLLALFLAACGGDDTTDPEPVPPPPPSLVDITDCADAPELLCAYLEVPLDHAQPRGETLRLAVTMQRNTDAPRGVALWLDGGPGGAGRRMLRSFGSRMPPALAEAYRWVGLDFRGTGETAIDCPTLQAETGFSDIRPGSPAALAECIDVLGEDRQFYSSSATVADLELLRQALGAETWVLNGISYGTYTASAYATTHPERVSRIVLDSPVPHTGLDSFSRPALRMLPFVIEAHCMDEECPQDPMAVLAAAASLEPKPIELYDMLTGWNGVNPSATALFQALQAAAVGDRSALAGLIRAYQQNTTRPGVRQFSTGLHRATLCSDMIAPWGDSATPLAGRLAALQAAASVIDEAEFWPFDRATMLDNVLIHDCLAWPPTSPGTQRRDGLLPDLPTLILAGFLDLSTPLPEAFRQEELAPGGRLVIIDDVGHGVQGAWRGLTNTVNFLCDEPYEYPVDPEVRWESC
ncbi:MAG: alpha/beta hydrolase [Pigmentiphaga sp.]|nr:alpha/beta hydrolase [Pigmentiphaga sp.]